MKVVVIGATGPTGIELVSRALDEGHEVTAFARNPPALSSYAFYEHKHLEKFTGDVLQPLTVERAIKGHDAVLVAIGPRRHAGTGETPVNVCSVATRHVLEAMAKHGTKRLVVLSSAGVGESRGKHQAGIAGILFESLVVPTLLKRQFKDKELQESLVRESTVDWVIVQPTALTNGDPKGAYKVAIDGSRVPARIARADVAAFMVDQVTSDTYLHKAPVIGG
jgi:putative NADH-flavin reductase